MPRVYLRNIIGLLGLVGVCFLAGSGSADDKWAFQTIPHIAVPKPPDSYREWVRNPIDAFVLEKLLAKRLKPSPKAEKRILARRVFLDLTGLPPTPEELDAFLKDTTPDAYEKLVDRLLASPRYGERWARHWLDVAHYADSHGQDQDRFRPNAWPYRDYLIHSFNEDKPYGRFVKEQIAGDVLFPDDPAAIVATGFLAAGPWDESGLRDINENSIDRQIARDIDRDDIVTTTMTTFAGLTVHCARCHDHKFDPISQEEYYSMQAVFAGIDKAERAYDPDLAIAKKRRAIHAELARIKALKEEAELLTPERLAEVAAFEKTKRESKDRWQVLAADSWKSRDGATLKPQADHSILSTGTAPERDVYTVHYSTNQVEITGIRLELLCDESLPHKGPGRQDNGNLHLSEIRVMAYPKGKPAEAQTIKLIKAIADFDQHGWGVTRAIDSDSKTAWGIFPEVGKPHQALFAFEKPIGFIGGTTLTIELDQLHGGSHLIGRFRIAVTTAEPLLLNESPLPTAITQALAVPDTKRTSLQNASLARWVWEQRIDRELKSLPQQSKIYCGTNQFAPDGSFKPSAKPRPIHVLKRGEVTRPGELANPAAIAAVKGLSAKFDLKDSPDEGQRRIALANWLAADANPLTWRVIVNRVWHYHFGKGIVDTPNDFGAMGGKPSHPELLDWLATDFRSQGGSLKKLHKLIVTSSTYRQSARHDTAATAIDADNRLLWRMNRGKLDAEAVRDAILQITGKLDEKQYGPPVKHFLTKPGIHVTPEANYEAFNVDAPEARRRSIYRFIFRTKPDPLLAGLDCPDASQSAPVRTASLGAPQALVLWNNKFILRYSEHLATLTENASSAENERVRFACLRVLGRIPTMDEEKAWTAYAVKYGMANLCRVLFNSSEFLFID